MKGFYLNPLRIKKLSTKATSLLKVRPKLRETKGKAKAKPRALAPYSTPLFSY